MSVAILFVGQLRGTAHTWMVLNQTFHPRPVYVSMWRPSLDPVAKCACFARHITVHKARWLDPSAPPTLATSLTADQMNLESYAYSLFKGVQMLVDASHDTVACVRSDVVYLKPIAFIAPERDRVVFGAPSRFGRGACAEMPDERFFYASRATMLRIGQLYVHLDAVHARMRRDPGFARWSKSSNVLPKNASVLNNPEGFLGRYLQWMDIACDVSTTRFRQINTVESRWFHHRPIRFDAKCT